MQPLRCNHAALRFWKRSQNEKNGQNLRAGCPEDFLWYQIFQVQQCLCYRLKQHGSRPRKKTLRPPVASPTAGAAVRTGCFSSSCKACGSFHYPLLS
eukprot:217877-Amphidinium_carterae.1